MERVVGREPRDVVTIENSSPEQLTTPATTLELADKTLRHIAIKSYLEARKSGAQERHCSSPSSQRMTLCAKRPGILVADFVKH